MVRDAHWKIHPSEPDGAEDAETAILVDADFAEILAEWFDRLGEAGLEIKPTSGYRTMAQQRALHRRAGSGVVVAPAGRSYHNYGLALDFIAVPRGRQAEAAGLAESLGLYWGGRFRPPDSVHLDARNYVSLADARRLGFPGELIEVV